MHSKGSAPWFFFAPDPHHFRIRNDIVDELCLDDEFTAQLPRTSTQHAVWLSIAGAAADSFPMAELRPQNYVRGDRFILRALTISGASFYTVTNRMGWAVGVQVRGLPRFLLERAAAYAAHRGFDFEFAFKKLSAPKVEGRERTEAEWAIGFERNTGLCQILNATESFSLAGYLIGARDVATPFDPIF